MKLSHLDLTIIALFFLSMLAIGLWSLLRPIAIPLLFGLLPVFKRSGPAAAISSIIGGLLTFIYTKIFPTGSLALDISLPIIVSTIIYVGIGLLKSKNSAEHNKAERLISELAI